MFNYFSGKSKVDPSNELKGEEAAEEEIGLDNRLKETLNLPSVLHTTIRCLMKVCRF